MNLELTDDQRMLKDMLDRLVADTGGVEAHRAAARMPRGWSPDMWREIVELGLPAMLLDEALGGLAGGGTELMIVGEALGRGLIAAPYLENGVLAAPILAAGDGDTAARALASLIDGSRSHALVTEGVTATGDRLSGAVRNVRGGDSADTLIVAAGDGIFIVPADAEGLRREGYPVHGGGRAANLHFDAVAATRILTGEAARKAVAAAEARRITYLAAMALGLASHALDTTIDYLNTRVQFGQPLGANQSLQHRAAEMYVELEQLRSATILAACMLDEADQLERERVMVAVAATVARTTRFIAQQAVQLHGGIGVTDEHVIGHCFLNLTAITIALGGVDANVTRLSDLGGFVSREPYWEAAR
ncbi:acyl-CoA dehydrogenase family protein [Sphingomonas sp. MG17]|uniref:Acyl-CoA dehydrogenase family protein n=1 Tax=Sphingomonas tagetis TaxID=2949092 RepID=A0A9X2HP92_9SPHN|nr:acyl-CoA dehydrogenase family protein [Sphingomonas tagetis]